MCGRSTTNAGAFSSILFQVVLLLPEKVRMCTRGTGLLNKLKEVEKLFCSVRLEIVSSLATDLSLAFFVP